MIERLNGNKTYLALALFAILHVLVSFGVVDDAAGKMLEPILACGAAAALRDAVKKAEVPSD